MKIDKFTALLLTVIHLGMVLNMKGTSDLYAAFTVFVAIVAYYFLLRVIFYRIKKEALECEKEL